MKILFSACIFLFGFLQLAHSPLFTTSKFNFKYPLVWDILFPISTKYGIDCHKADQILWLESRRNPKCIELAKKKGYKKYWRCVRKRNGKCTDWRRIRWRWKIISRGLFQICNDTITDYLKAHDYDPKKEDYLKWAYTPEKNIDIFCWQFSQYLRIYKGSYYKAMSAHNMGLHGFRKYSKKYGRYCYWKYVNNVKRDYKIWERKFRKKY